MKKLMLICSVTFMFLLLGSSASAQTATQTEAIQTIRTYLQELPSTKTVAISSANLGGGLESPTSTQSVPASRLEKRLFEELSEAILTEASLTSALNVVINRYESPNATKSSLVAFRVKAEELLSL